MRQSAASGKWVPLRVVADVDLIDQRIEIIFTDEIGVVTAHDATWVGDSSTNWQREDSITGTIFQRYCRWFRQPDSMHTGYYTLSYNLHDQTETGPDPVYGDLTLY
jgi:hypothetical protein